MSESEAVQDEMLQAAQRESDDAPAALTPAERAALRERHVQHHHDGGCHRRYDGPAIGMVDLRGPAPYGECLEDWPCSHARLLADLEAVEAERDALREALRFYSDERHYEVGADTMYGRGAGGQQITPEMVIRDNGAIARAALARSEP